MLVTVVFPWAPQIPTAFGNPSISCPSSTARSMLGIPSRSASARSGFSREIAAEYPQIEFNDMIIDALCMRLVQTPEAFDVLVMPNLYGDIVSDLCAGLVGGPGLAPSANIGHGRAIFEAVHGSAPQIAGQGIANPTALILSGAMMLRHIGESEAAEKIEGAVSALIAEGRQLTGDLGGTLSTSAYADALIARLG